MIKTKKAIYQWYCDKGNDIANYEDYNDILSKLDSSIERRLSFIFLTGGSKLELNKARWRYPVILWFTKENECYSIRGF